MRKITTHLWYDREAREAADLYTSLFSNSKIDDISILDNTPSGSVDIVTAEIAGEGFTLLSAGPYFKFNPSVSLLVACDTRDEVDLLWKNLSEGGSSLMELGSYPFSDRYAWIQDRYGLSWQLMYFGDRKIYQKITPTLMFTGSVYGRAEEAVNFYTKVFSSAESVINYISRYEKGEAPDKEGSIKHAGFTLLGRNFAAMDSAYDHKFSFNEAVSFIVNCETQDEIDYYWNALSAVPEAEQCGWLKDKFGVSWQIVPSIMNSMMKDSDKEKISRVTEAFLKMKKFDITALKKAYKGE